ncbi:MAG: chemotaxis protein CheB [Bacteroidetes bacterium]|nr:chemotaxis protein CheB [Bacteroidota bacterium]
MIKVGVIAASGRFDSWIRQTLNDSQDLIISGFWNQPDGVPGDSSVADLQVLLVFFENSDADKNLFQVLKNCFLLYRKPVILVTEEFLWTETEAWSQSFPVVSSLTVSELYLPDGREHLREAVRMTSYVSREILDSFLDQPAVSLQVPTEEPAVPEQEPETPGKSAGIPVLLIGASTGGPKVILDLVKKLGKWCETYAIVIAQHLSHSFLEQFIQQVQAVVPVQVELIQTGVQLRQGVLFLAPVRRQFILGSEGFFVPDPGRHLYPFMPNIDVLFKSIALFSGKEVICLILSGLGRDGTEGARLVRRTGGLVITQQPGTAEISSMPDSVTAAGLQHFILTPDEMAKFLKNYAVKTEL